MRKHIISMLAAAAVTVFLTYNFLTIQKEQTLAQTHLNQLAALQVLATVSGEIEAELNQGIQYADFFDVLLSQDPDITSQTASDYAKLILNQNKNIVSVQLAPNGIVSMIYPLEGNEAAIGHNLFTDPERSPYAWEAVEKRGSVAQGPIHARQGGYLVFNRKAVFITVQGQESFWGLSIIAIDFTRLISKYEEKLSNEQYRFALRRQTSNGPPEILWGEGDVFTKDAITKRICLPSNEWEIAIYPKLGWEKISPAAPNMDQFFYLLAMLSFFLTYWCIHFYQEKIEESQKEHLTETFNKNAFQKFVNKRFAKKGAAHALVLIDLDNFKQVNDSFGHPVGDAALIEISRRINSVLRGTDRLSRFGGDEYLIFINHIQESERVKQIVDRMEQRVAAPMKIDGIELSLHISAGFALFPQDGDSFEALYKIADRNMYFNKALGKTEREATDKK